MIKKMALRQAYKYLEKDPVENMPKLYDWVMKYVPHAETYPQLKVFKPIIEDPSNNWSILIQSLWTDIDPGVRKTFMENFFINGFFDWADKKDKMEEKYDCNIPWTILMDPTTACNLKCTGCWAAEYGHQMNMSFETLDSIIRQAKDLGIHVFIYSGGEPLVRKKDLIKLCEIHSDCVFASFTNGTLIDEDFADEMLRVKNFIPTISVEGFEASTDFRRGEGTFKAITRAMEILREKKLPFGISNTYTSQNTDVIVSEEYFDWMVDQGAKFAWFFTYMPIGVDSPTDLMANADQREHVYRQLRKFRSTKPIFTIDFWNDGEYVNGCIAGAKNYLHINANGDVEPCAFIHYSDSNIYENSLVEAFQRPLFTAYKEGQPFSDNLMRPCPLLDNPGALSDMVHKSGAKSTDMQSPEDVDSLTEKCRDKAEKWKPEADRLWKERNDRKKKEEDSYKESEKIAR